MGYLEQQQWRESALADEADDLLSCAQKDIGTGEIVPEAGRYHLYTSLACPFGHRVVLARNLKHLEKVVGISLVECRRRDQAWSFRELLEGRTNDTLNNSGFLYELYLRHDENYSGACPVPLLWDRYEERIVASGYSAIMKVFNSAFTDLLEGERVDIFAENSLIEIDRRMDWVDEYLHDAVFAFAYEDDAVSAAEIKSTFYRHMRELDDYLKDNPYLVACGKSAADWCLFTFLLHYEYVYSPLFGFVEKSLVDFPNLRSLMCDLYQDAGVGASVLPEQICSFYYSSLKLQNPSGHIPEVPEVNFNYLGDNLGLF